MPTHRKIGWSLILIMFILSLTPPLMDILFNKPGEVLGLPIFLVGLTGLSLGVIAVAAVMYAIESRQEDRAEAAGPAGGEPGKGGRRHA